MNLWSALGTLLLLFVCGRWIGSSLLEVEPPNQNRSRRVTSLLMSRWPFISGVLSILVPAGLPNEGQHVAMKKEMGLLFTNSRMYDFLLEQIRVQISSQFVTMMSDKFFTSLIIIRISLTIFDFFRAQHSLLQFPSSTP